MVPVLSAPLPVESLTDEVVLRMDGDEPFLHSFPKTRGDSADPHATTSAPPPRDGFIKHYEIIRTLGEGGMGIVLLARDTKLGRLVAIKLLQDSGRATTRLLAEAQATARCKHDNIVVVHDVDETDGHPYMVLEYLEGRRLRDLLSTDANGVGRALAMDLALDIVTSVVRALVAAHELDVVHRDLKPENIMILDTGQVKVLDFGLAKRGDSNETQSCAGTWPYMSPEQWQAGPLDARSDLWAVGILLYELLTGAHPLAPLTKERNRTIADTNTKMPRLRDVQPERTLVSEIIERCLQKNRDGRFASAAELLVALEHARKNDTPSARTESELPFAGLSAFQEADAARFFGRQRDIAAVVGRLRRQPLVIVAGPSGAGKSSFLRAGVIPALRRSNETWDTFILRPGRNPIAALAEVLAEGTKDGALRGVDLATTPGLVGATLRVFCRAFGPERRALVLVDQFEELYTLLADPIERAAFLACLLGIADDSSSPLRVVLSIRSDFLDRMAADRQFMTQVAAGLFFLPPIGREGQRDALMRPVEAAGYRFENEAMIEDMLDELASAKTPLPLLQFAASELWEARDRDQKLITRQNYDKLGGIAGSLATHADAVFAALSPPDQRLCQAIFLRLVTPERTRALASMPEIASLAGAEGAAGSLVQYLCGARLLLLERAGDMGSITVEIVHESLIERWPTLTRWLDESTADAHLLARLRPAALQWKASDEAQGLLWRDRAAEEARTFYERRKTNLSAAQNQPLSQGEERYLLSVITHFERGQRIRQRSIALAFAFLSAISALVFFLAMRARDQARRADAEATRVKEQNEQLSFQALRGRNAMRLLAARKRQDDPTLALALLREVEPEDIPKDWPELVSAALSNGVARDVISDLHGGEPIYGLAVSPDGTRFVTASGDKTARVWSSADHRLLATLTGHEQFLWSALWSPNGKRIVTASHDKTARIWSADGSGTPLVLRGHEEAVNAAEWSPDGKRVVTASDDGTALVFDADTGKQLVVLRHPTTEIQSASFSPNGKRIVTASADALGRVWDAAGETKPLLLRGHTDVLTAAAWSPDGERIATASKDATVRVWDAQSGAELFTLRGHEDKVMDVLWSGDGKHLISASRDKTTRIWSADGKGFPIVLRGHGHWVYTASLSSDGHNLLTVSLDKTLRAWDLHDIVQPVALIQHNDVINSIDWSPDSVSLLTASTDMMGRISNIETGRFVVLAGHEQAVYLARFSPDGHYVATGSSDMTVRVWRVDGSSLPIVLRGHQASITDLDWSPKGDRLVTSSKDGVIRVWSSEGFSLLAETKVATEAGTFPAAHFAPQGLRVAVTNDSRSVFLWDTDQPGEPFVLGRHDAPVSSFAWSPDGSRIVSAATDDSTAIWDLRNEAPPIMLRGAFASSVTAAWSPDGQRIVASLLDKTARVVRVDGVGEPVVLRGSTDQIRNARFSPDGATIATASLDGMVRVWNADGSGVPFVLGGARVLVSDVSWSPDGKHLAARSEEKIARVWRAIRPFSGTDDQRLWAATSYCIPALVRMELLQVSPTQAQEDESACERRVLQARAGAGSR